MNTIFDVPHSRFNRVTEKQFEQAGMKVLVQSDEAGTHIAVSDDGFRLVCMQGHPEYDMVSLFKEYKREVNLYKAGFYKEKPPFPVHYFSPDIAEILENSDLNEIEEQILPGLENTWTDSARSILASWTGLVYQITNLDRSKQFMDGIDPENPLGI
jgi:homoserine O-succinyltransferase